VASMFSDGGWTGSLSRVFERARTAEGVVQANGDEDTCCLARLDCDTDRGRSRRCDPWGTTPSPEGSTGETLSGSGAAVIFGSRLGQHGIVVRRCHRGDDSVAVEANPGAPPCRFRPAPMSSSYS
jgi:hypothetical protein